MYSCSLLIVGIIFSDLIILVCFLSMHVSQSFFLLLGLNSIALLMVVDFLSALLSDLLFSLSISESDKWGSLSGSVFSPCSILSTSLESYITLALVA